MNASDEQIASILPGVDKEIRDLVRSIMPQIPLDDDFKLRTYAQLDPPSRVNFLEDQYRLSVIFSTIFKKQLSRILQRDVSNEIDFLFENSYLYNEGFILANTVSQFRILTSLISKKHNLVIYDHESRLPAELKERDCGLCGAKLVYRNGSTNDNNQGYIVGADQHVFHYTCLSNRLVNTEKCPECYKQIDKRVLHRMSAEEKRLATVGSNFLAGGRKISRRR